MWMLDTNMCSYVLRRRPPSVKAQFDRVGHGNLAISSIVLAELLFGAEKHPNPDVIREEIEDMAGRLRVLPWGRVVSIHYARVRFQLERAGTPIGNMDLLIAAHALAEGAVLVTNNVREFERVPDLKLENWV